MEDYKNIEEIEELNKEEIEEYLDLIGVPLNDLLGKDLPLALYKYLNSDTLKDFYITYIKCNDLCNYK